MFLMNGAIIIIIYNLSPNHLHSKDICVLMIFTKGCFLFADYLLICTMRRGEEIPQNRKWVENCGGVIFFDGNSDVPQGINWGQPKEKFRVLHKTRLFWLSQKRCDL